MDENDVGRVVIDTAIGVHRELGPGLLEAVYEAVLAHELHERGLWVERQVPIRVSYRGHTFDEGFRMDVPVESRVVLEIKSVEQISNAHRKQLLTYLRLSGMKLGFLLNFGAALMRDGIVRTANGMPLLQ